MQKVPLGWDEKTWDQRHDNVKKIFKNDYWKKGYKSGRKGKLPENPYALSSDIWELLRKRTLWFLGYEEGFIARKIKHNHQHKASKHEQLHHIEELSKKHKHKRKHKHHGH